MAVKHGNLSINSDNIFPIIKKWMYSDQDIFVRELVSNACDAITKLKKLSIAGEYDMPEDYKAKISIVLDDKEKTLKITDNGIGMTADEVEEYITQIAFSGATEFLEKYKDKADEDQIIGHFGLGFYSAFMVADEVHIDTLSYKGGESVHWTCDGSTDYEMEEGNKESVGTEITLYLNENCYEYSNLIRVRDVLEKYCSFMPVEIYISQANAEPEYETIDESELKETDTVIENIHEDAKTEEKENDKGEKETVEVSPAKDLVKILKRPVPVNDIHPLWTKRPNECTDEEYKDFYRKVFRDYKEPLFWIHLNMDYPFNLKGILYFPRINTEYESIEGTIKLYNNQVFIADNIKEVIPDYLLLLKGVIDCPDLPLNVSRSALQNDGFVTKISDYISKKVADKLSGMCKTDRENYEKYWDDISPFIKFGCIRDKKFSDKMMDYILYKDINDKYLTFKDLVPATEEKPEEGKEKEAEIKEEDKPIVYYVTDPVQQGQYISLFKEQGKDAVILRHNIDTSFITHVERVENNVRFQRIDAHISDELKDGDEDLTEITNTLQDVFRKNLGNDKLNVTVENLKNEKTAAIITLSEEERRVQEMMKMYGMGGMNMDAFKPNPTLVLNNNHPLIKYIAENKDAENTADVCRQVYDLALIANQPLSPDEMSRFIERSQTILMNSLK